MRCGLVEFAGLQRAEKFGGSLIGNIGARDRRHTQYRREQCNS